MHAALLAPEPIPMFLFREHRVEFGRQLASLIAGDGLDEAVAALRTFALVDREGIADERDGSFRADCIRVHRLVRETAAARRETSMREGIRAALMTAIENCYPEHWDDFKSWPRARRLLPHALSWISRDIASPRVEKMAADLLTKIAVQFEASVDAR